MLDMIRPLNKHAITLKDLKQCKMTPVFFDTFFNLEKYLDHEQRDPFATQRETDEDGNEVTFNLDAKKMIFECFSFPDVGLGPICSGGIRASRGRGRHCRADGRHVSQNFL